MSWFKKLFGSKSSSQNFSQGALQETKISYSKQISETGSHES